MNEVTLIFPHQLFKKNTALHKNRTVFLIEEFLFFKQYNFHKQKLLLHRTSMKTYEAYLIQHGFTVEYIESIDERNNIRKLITFLKKKNFQCSFHRSSR